MTLTAKLDELAERASGTSPTCERCSSTARSRGRPRYRTRRASPTSRSPSWRRTASRVDVVRAVDHDIATGVYSDMTEHGWDRDDWPADPRAGDGRRHSRALRADLARREVVDLHAE